TSTSDASVTFAPDCGPRFSVVTMGWTQFQDREFSLHAERLSARGKRNNSWECFGRVQWCCQARFSATLFFGLLRSISSPCFHLCIQAACTSCPGGDGSSQKIPQSLLAIAWAGPSIFSDSHRYARSQPQPPTGHCGPFPAA